MRRVMLISVISLLTSAPAMAHTGVGLHFDFASGLMHPLLGLDHLLAMVGVGLWAAIVGGKAMWIWPLAFVTTMVTGGLLGIAGIAVPATEAVIIASVVGIGAAVAFGLRLPLAAGAVVCAAFAIAHGAAHGAELPAGASPAAYVAGFVVATLALHAVGIAIGVALQRSPGFARGMGAFIAACGALLAFG